MAERGTKSTPEYGVSGGTGSGYLVRFPASPPIESVLVRNIEIEIGIDGIERTIDTDPDSDFDWDKKAQRADPPDAHSPRQHLEPRRKVFPSPRALPRLTPAADAVNPFAALADFPATEVADGL
jgi:hypothetical protein